MIAPETPGAFDEASIDPYTAVVLLYHDLDAELPIVRAALGKTPFYIGSLGSSKTHFKRLEALQASGYGEDVVDRIHAPIGLVKAKDARRSVCLSLPRSRPREFERSKGREG